MLRWLLLGLMLLASPAFAQSIAPSTLVGTNLALQATSTSAYGMVVRLGFTTPFDSPAVTYYSSSTTCSIPGGNNTTEVAPNNGNGCWLSAPAAGGISGPGSVTTGYLPTWVSTTSLGAGYPVGLTGISTVPLTTSAGLLTPSILPLATNSTLGGVIGDGTTTTVNGSGVISAIGGASTSIVLGTTTIGGSPTTGDILYINGTLLGQKAVTGTGAVALASNPTLASPQFTAPTQFTGNSTWPGTSGSGGLAPLYQNDVLSGTITSAAGSFGMYLMQEDETTGISTQGVLYGLSEYLNINSATAQGGRIALNGGLSVLQATGNTTGQSYVGVSVKCTMSATDPSPSVSPAAYSTCFGGDLVSTVGPGVTVNSLIGLEVDTPMSTTGVVNLGRIGIQVSPTFTSGYLGIPTLEDIGIATVAPSTATSTYGFAVGFSVGELEGYFPVRTTGTLFSATGHVTSTAYTVAKGFDLTNGTFTTFSFADGHFEMTGAGEFEFAKISDPGTAPGASTVKLTAEAGTTTGTCKIVARAGTSATPVTIIDNVGSGC